MSLSNKPQEVNASTWYYEDEDGIDVVHEVRRRTGEYFRTDHIKIPWIMIRRSLARKDKKKPARV